MVFGGRSWGIMFAYSYTRELTNFVCISWLLSVCLFFYHSLKWKKYELENSRLFYIIFWREVGNGAITSSSTGNLQIFLGFGFGFIKKGPYIFQFFFFSSIIGWRNMLESKENLSKKPFLSIVHHLFHFLVLNSYYKYSSKMGYNIVEFCIVE